MRAQHRIGLAYVASLLCPGPAGATYSLCATDAGAREVGGTGASCVAPSSVYIIYGSAPGHGVVHAQASANTAGRDEAVAELSVDTPPADIIVNITDPTFDPNFQSRQYGVVDLMSRAAGFTGTFTFPYTEDRQGLAGDFAYSAQGNILTSVAVLDNAEDAFVNGGGCDLADRLMLALEGGAMGGEGDSRCTPNGIPANSAFIQVDREGEPAQSYLYLEYTDDTGTNPVTQLRALYDAWRATHPCPALPDGGLPDVAAELGVPDMGTDFGVPPDSASPDAGGTPDLGIDSGPEPTPDTAAPADLGTDAPPADTAPDAPPPDTGAPPDVSVSQDGNRAVDSAAPDMPGRDGGPDGAKSSAGQAGGCACALGTAAGDPLVALLLAGVLLGGRALRRPTRRCGLRRGWRSARRRLRRRPCA